MDVRVWNLETGTRLGRRVVEDVRRWRSPVQQIWYVVRLDDGTMLVRRSTDAVAVVDFM